jgi:hypothetical protein
MKYFTPELLNRVRSRDDDVSGPAHADWERAIKRYHRRWRQIQARFPVSVQRFRQQLCLHDAQVLGMAQHDAEFLMVVQLEPPAQTLVFLTFTLPENPQNDRNALLGGPDSSYLTWMYEEFDLDRQQNCYFEVLLSNGWAVRLRFRDFKFLTGDNLLSARNCQVWPAPQYREERIVVNGATS